MSDKMTQLTEIETYALLRRSHGLRLDGIYISALLRARRKLFNQYYQKWHPLPEKDKE